MIIPKQKFLDRVEQSFIIFKNNILLLTIPFIIFNIITLVIIPTIIVFMVFQFINLEAIFAGNFQNISFVISTLIAGFIVWILVYLILLIPIQLGLLKSVKQAINEEKITIKNNIFYGFSRILSAFVTYWYIFAYVFLIPALIFIVGGFLMIYGLFQGLGDSFSGIMILASFIMGFAVFIGMFYAIYRGIRSTFALTSALHKDSYNKENFLEAINITKGKFWRVFGNYLGIGIFGGLLIGLIGGLGEAVAYLGVDTSDFANFEEDQSMLGAIESVLSFNIFVFINNVFQNILGTLLGVYITVFSYIFYLRLSEESGLSHKESSGNSIKSLVEDEL